MTFLTEKALAFQHGAIREMFDYANRCFPNAINLGIGEPDMTTPAEVIEAAYAAMRAGYTHYTANKGILPLREKVAARICQQNPAVSMTPDNILITMGGMGALSEGLLVSLNPGDEVLVQDPEFLNYYGQVRLCDAVPVPVPLYEKDGVEIDPAEIEKRISPKTKVLMLNSPHNPTGAVISRKTTEQIAKLAVKHNLLVMSDEVYNPILYDGVEHYSIINEPGMQERTIIVNSFSKSFAMTGWRIGYAAGPADMIDKMTILQENLSSCVSSIAQYGALAAMDYPERSEEMREIYRRRRDILIDGLNSIPGISCVKPKGAFYAFPNISALGKSSVDLANDLLEKCEVVTVPGSAFGEAGEGYIRISYANSEENIRTALERIRKYVENL